MRGGVTLAAMSETLNIESPCKLICTLDILTGVCKGCGRTREDIAGWVGYSAAQKAFANIEAENRLRDYASEEGRDERS